VIVTAYIVEESGVELITSPVIKGKKGKKQGSEQERKVKQEPTSKQVKQDGLEEKVVKQDVIPKMKWEDRFVEEVKAKDHQVKREATKVERKGRIKDEEEGIWLKRQKRHRSPSDNAAVGEAQVYTESILRNLHMITSHTSEALYNPERQFDWLDKDQNELEIINLSEFC